MAAGSVSVELWHGPIRARYIQLELQQDAYNTDVREERGERCLQTASPVRFDPSVQAPEKYTGCESSVDEPVRVCFLHMLTCARMH